MLNESHSDFTEYLIADYRQRKGFYIGKNLKNIGTLTINFVINYMLAYQPLSWEVIDVSRYMIDKANRIPDLQP